MATNVSFRALKLLGRSLALTCSLAMGTVARTVPNGGMVQGRAVVGDDSSSGLREDWRNPAYWGLKKGEYIPGPGCFTGSWGRKKFAYEICATIRYL